MKILDYFDRAFVINLPERTDRRQEMQAELCRAGMVDDTGKVEFFPAVRPSEPAGFPSCAARGCYLSHLEVLRKAYSLQLERVLVMEDDLAISPDFVRAQDEVVRRLAVDDWHFAYLGHALDIPSALESPFQAWQEPIVLAHFYAVRKPVLEGLIRFLEAVLERPPGHPEGGPMHVDGALSTYRALQPDLITLVATPNLGTQRSSRSDIHPAWFDGVPLLRQLASLARRGRRILLRSS